MTDLKDLTDKQIADELDKLDKERDEAWKLTDGQRTPAMQ
jgi:hypothetical protein